LLDFVLVVYYIVTKCKKGKGENKMTENKITKKQMVEMKLHEKIEIDQRVSIQRVYGG